MLRAGGAPALLPGPPSTGKTSPVEAAFPDLITVAGDGDTTVGDFVGEYTQRPDGTYEFIYGPLIRAMREGRVLFIDDATLISPAVLAVCYPAMDGRREVTVKAYKGETITADGFYVVADHNPGVHGAVLTEALSFQRGRQVRGLHPRGQCPGRRARPRPARLHAHPGDRLRRPVQGHPARRRAKAHHPPGSLRLPGHLDRPEGHRQHDERRAGGHPRRSRRRQRGDRPRGRRQHPHRLMGKGHAHPIAVPG